jgi:predicted metalloprotease with PDZ domain
MKYKLDTSNSNQHYLNIEFCSKVSEKETLLQLPSWRPGRYELGNFAKNIQHFEVVDEKGNLLKAKKVTKDSWVVDTANCKEIKVKYNYYSVDFNAGSTYLDSEVLYVNPVNCFIYIPKKINEKCTVEIPKEKDQEIACGIPYKSGKIITKDFHELVDTPFIVSSVLQSDSFVSKGVTFTVWFYGECKPDWEKVIPDFKKFTDYQNKVFGDFPAEEYHFINIIHPYKAYHGVEHTSSTIIILGPSYEVMKDRYVDLLGVSSHELYHAWNIKTIRPVEMNPYDYTQENYSTLGYIAEGVTTYMGDLVLFESGVFDRDQYCVELNQYLKRHYSNGGRLNKSVAESSYDTWLDGYVPGVPDRKSSIYVEGALISFMIDTMIREGSKGDYSLHTVMKDLYQNFGKKGIGYTELDYKNLIEKYSGKSMTDFFNNYIWDCKDFTAELKKNLKLRGFKLKKNASELATEQFGIILKPNAAKANILHIEPNSAAYLAGLSREDKVLSINGHLVNHNLDNWLAYFYEDVIVLEVLRNKKTRTVLLPEANNHQFWDYTVN